jgi:hypothetical protein
VDRFDEELAKLFRRGRREMDQEIRRFHRTYGPVAAAVWHLANALRENLDAAKTRDACPYNLEEWPSAVLDAKAFRSRLS